MAEPKRTSARSVNSSSNRTAAPAAAKPAGSGIRPAAGSGIRPSVKPVEAPPPPPPPPPIQSARRGHGAVVVKKKPPFPMKEILITAGILAVILAIALIVGYIRSSKYHTAETAVEIQTHILERNVELAKAELDKAVKLGTLFTVGKEVIEPKDQAKLFVPFKGNDKIYNVIYNRDFKAKNNPDKHELYALVEDTEHKTIKFLNKAIPEDKMEKDTTIQYGLTDKELMPVVVAKRIIHPTGGDLVNTGGQIMVIVKAEEDDSFKRGILKAREAPQNQTSVETKPTPKVTPPTDTKAPAEGSAPAGTKSGETPATPEKTPAPTNTIPK